MKNRYAMATALLLCLAHFNSITSRVAPGVGGQQIGDITVSPPISPTISPHISPNISPTISPNISPIINIFIGITQEMATNIHTYITSKFKAIHETGQKAYADASASLGDLKEWASHNKLKITAYSLVSLYSYITYRLFTLKYSLIQADNWSLWNNTLSYDELCSLPQVNLGEMLIKEAQQRYTLIDDPENFITPIVTFLQTVEQEKKLLTNYISLCGWITTARLGKIFWFDEALTHACEERLKRLAYIRAVFVNWITEYKFLHTTVPAAL
jgi:hypothetical protein